MNTETTEPMDIEAMVDTGMRLRAEIAEREAKLKAVEKALRSHAEANPEMHVQLKDEGREGTRCVLRGSGTNAISVVFTADAIIQSMPEKSPVLETVRTLAGERFLDFYRRTVTFEAVHSVSGKFDGKAFREHAREVLEKPEEFIAACVRKTKDGIPVSQTRMEWGAD